MSATVGDDVYGEDDAVKVFHAGTATKEGRIVTQGGRVLGVTGLDSSLQGATNRAYQMAASIEFEGRYYRKDIAHRVLAPS